MLKIHILGSQKVCYTRQLHPIRVFRQQLLEHGLDARYFRDPLGRGIEDCDVLLFFDKNFWQILPTHSKELNQSIEFLAQYLQKFERTVWFDNQDSSGWLKTYILPLVDVYAKAQLLKDTAYYQENHLTGSLHLDYVHEKYGVEGKTTFLGAVTDDDLKKLRIGWNLSLVNWRFFTEGQRLVKHLWAKQLKSYRVHFTEPNLSQRKLQVVYRVGMWKNVPTVYWWRNHTGEVVNEFKARHPEYAILSGGSTPLNQYHRDMQNAIVCPSPFGHGEIGYRDFESFMNGSLMFKADMDHLRTWPDLFVKDETYVAHAWDFSDFDDQLERILTHPEQYEAIAREGQQRFRQALSDGHAFAEQFKAIIS